MDETLEEIRVAIVALVDAGVQKGGYEYAAGMLMAKLESVMWQYLTEEQLGLTLGSIESLTKHVNEEVEV